MSSVLILTLSLFSTVARAQSSPSDKCLGSAEILRLIESFEDRMDPLLRTLDRAVVFRYTHSAKSIAMSTLLENPDEIVVDVVGRDCRGLIQRDEIQLMLCHEIGRVAGGAPFAGVATTDEGLDISARGQADFFAASSCLPLAFSGDNIGSLDLVKNYPELEMLCPAKMDNNRRGTCMRIAVAGLRMAQFAQAEENARILATKKKASLPSAPHLSTQDLTFVNRTLLTENLSAQCRLDTFLAGARCPSLSQPANYTENSETSLLCAENVELATQPTCWKALEL